MSRFYIRLRELRKSRSLSQQELAKLLKISKSSINMYERGEREPGIDMLELIADFFNVDMDFLTGKSDAPCKFTAAEPILSPTEQELVDRYRSLPEWMQRLARDNLNALYREKQEYDKMQKNEA